MNVSIWEYQSDTVESFAWDDKPILMLVLQTSFNDSQKEFELTFGLETA